MRFIRYQAWLNDEYGTVVDNIFQEQAIRTLQRAYRALRKKRNQSVSDIPPKAISQVTNSNSILKVISEPTDNRYLDLTKKIKDKHFSHLDFTDADFIPNLYKSLRLNTITLSEFFLLYQMYYTKEWFGHFDFNCDEMAHVKFSDTTGPYQASSIKYATPSSTADFLSSLSPDDAHYVTMNLSKTAEQTFFEAGMQIYYSEHRQTSFFYTALKKHLAKRITAYRLDNDAPSAFYLLANWSMSDIALSKMDLKTRAEFNYFFSKKLINENDAKKSDELDYLTMSFLQNGLTLEEELPSFVISTNHRDSDCNTPTLSFVLMSLDAFNKLQLAMHGLETTVASPIAGQFDIRTVRDYFEKKSGQYERPIELTHPSLPAIAAPHGYRSHKQMTTWHDLVHAWRASANFKAMFQHLLNLFTQKGVCQTKKCVMSKAITSIVDMDRALGQYTRKKNKDFDPLTDFEKTTQLLFLDVFESLVDESAKSRDILTLIAIDFLRNEEKWDQFVASILNITTYRGLFISYFTSAISHASAAEYEFSHELNSLLRSRRFKALCNEPALTTESIILRKSLSTPSADLLCKTVDAIGIEKLFYWGPNTGLHFHHALRGSIDANFSLPSYAHSSLSETQCEGVILFFIKASLPELQYRKFLHDTLRIDDPFFELKVPYKTIAQDRTDAITAGLFSYDSLDDFLKAFECVSYDATKADPAFAHSIDQVVPLIKNHKDFWTLAESLSRAQFQSLLDHALLSDELFASAMQYSKQMDINLFPDIVSEHARTTKILLRKTSRHCAKTPSLFQSVDEAPAAQQHHNRAPLTRSL